MLRDLNLGVEVQADKLVVSVGIKDNAALVHLIDFTILHDLLRNQER